MSLRREVELIFRSSRHMTRFH